MQKPTAEITKLAESAKVEVCQFSEVEDLGKEQPQDAVVSWERLKIELFSFLFFFCQENLSQFSVAKIPSSTQRIINLYLPEYSKKKK